MIETKTSSSIKTIFMNILHKIWAWEARYFPKMINANEYLAGFIGGLITLLLFGLFSHIWWLIMIEAFIMFNILSIYYETHWDLNGWENGKDVWTRWWGFGVAVIVWALILHQ